MEWNEHEHFVLVFMKMSVLKPKTGSINSGTCNSAPKKLAPVAVRMKMGQLLRTKPNKELVKLLLVIRFPKLTDQNVKKVKK